MSWRCQENIRARQILHSNPIPPGLRAICLHSSEMKMLQFKVLYVDYKPNGLISGNMFQNASGKPTP